jgi:hypothetical protein
MYYLPHPAVLAQTHVCVAGIVWSILLNSTRRYPIVYTWGVPNYFTVPRREKGFGVGPRNKIVGDHVNDYFELC